MTLFEYIAVAASLVCSFAALRLLGGVADAFQPGRRYWVHTSWIFLLVFLITLNWWLFWSYREVEWNYARFMLSLLPLGLLYVLTTLLVPSDAPRIRSWRDYYFEIRVRFFALNIAYVGALTVNTVVLLGHPVFHWRRVLPVILCAAFAAGLLSRSPRLHAAVILGVAAFNAAVATLFGRPGAFDLSP